MTRYKCMCFFFPVLGTLTWLSLSPADMRGLQYQKSSVGFSLIWHFYVPRVQREAQRSRCAPQLCQVQQDNTSPSVVGVCSRLNAGNLTYSVCTCLNIICMLQYCASRHISRYAVIGSSGAVLTTKRFCWVLQNLQVSMLFYDLGLQYVCLFIFDNGLIFIRVINLVELQRAF